MTREEAINTIRNSSFSKYTDVLASLLQPSARILLHRDAGNAASQQPQSFFGGQPQLPRGIDWPLWDRRERLQANIDRFEERMNPAPQFRWMRKTVEKWKRHLNDGPMPLAFLGQIFLGELNRSAPLQDWPVTGSLAFFYGDAAMPGNNKTADEGHCRVIFVPEDAGTTPAQFPATLEQSLRYPKFQVSFRSEWSLPSEPLNLDSNSRFWVDRKYLDLISEFMSSHLDPDQAPRRCGGHAQLVQGPMEPECQLIAENLSWAEYRSFDSEQRSQFEKRATDWLMLVQFASDERLNWMWGDVGLVYFWIPRKDLIAGLFENALALRQSS